MAATAVDPYQNTNKGLEYPVTKMNFLISVADVANGTAAFSQVTGIDATVDVIEFRQGNSNSLATVKIPGLVKHGNVTLRFGYTHDSGFKGWLTECLSESRKKTPRHNVSIELIDIRGGAPNGDKPQAEAASNPIKWVLTNAWVCKYNGPELDAKTSDVAIESVEIAYEELTIPNTTSSGGNSSSSSGGNAGGTAAT